MKNLLSASYCSMTAFLVLGLVFFSLACNNKPHPLSEDQATKIIARAKKILPQMSGTDTNVHRLIYEALDQMVVTEMDSSSKFILDRDHRFFFLIVSPSSISATKDTIGANLMIFYPPLYQQQNKIVVVVNRDLNALCRDPDIIATSLIHELIHGIQTSNLINHGISMDLAMSNQTLFFQDEIQAWNIQLDLYRKLHPDLFKGPRCDCRTAKFSNLKTKEQLDLLASHTGDRMVRTLVCYAQCGEPFLRILYAPVRTNYR